MGEAGWVGGPDQTILGFAELAAIVGGAVESYRISFDPLDGESDVFRPFLVCHDHAVPVDVFVRCHGTAGEA